MKKVIFVMMACLLGVAANAQTWVSFSKNEPATSEFSVINSDTQSVSFEVRIPGIYTIDTIVNGMSFTRLILPDGAAINPVGSPELPVLACKVAIPDCSGMEINYRIVSQQNIASCWVYPVPELVLDNNFGMLTEQFVFDPAVYALPRVVETVASLGYKEALRAQRFVEVVIQPIEFCPVTRQLSVVIEMM